jgi:hypothetical protein
MSLLIYSTFYPLLLSLSLLYSIFFIISESYTISKLVYFRQQDIILDDLLPGIYGIGNVGYGVKILVCALYYCSVLVDGKGIDGARGNTGGFELGMPFVL